MNIIKFLLGAVRYDYRDEFITALTAGNVHGTACEPGPGTRTVVDTDSKLSISSGKLNMAPHTTPVSGDPGFWITEAVTRAAGVMLKGQLNIADATRLFFVGFDANKTGTIGSGFVFTSDVVKYLRENAAQAALFSTLDNTDYEFLIALKATGEAFFIKDSGIWKFLGNWNDQTTATLYAGIANSTATLTSEYLRIPSERWLCSPLASDGFDE